MKSFFVVAALMFPTVALAITPATTGTASGTTVVVNADVGDQTEPHVSGNLAVYTNKDFVNGSSIHYYDFTAPGDHLVPAGAAGDSDNLSDVFGSKIAFSRTRTFGDGQTACMVYDAANNTLSEIAPAATMVRFGTVLGGNTVAFQELASGNGDIMVFDMSTNGPLTNVSPSLDSDGNPSLAPSGNAVVWECCVGSNCGIYRSVKSGGTWSGAEQVSDTTSNEGNPDTDGTTIVYDSERPSATNQDIYFQPLMGGTETALQLAGFQRNPSINGGVIAFESAATFGGVADLYVYILASNALIQVTNTPSVNESLNDVTVLSNGDIRLVWAANESSTSPDHDIYALTFSPVVADPNTGGSCDHGVAVCHVPPGNPGNAHTIHVGQAAVAAHLAHGDYLGPCGGNGSSSQSLNAEPEPVTGCSTAGGLVPMVFGLALLALVMGRRPAAVRSRRR